MLYVKISAYFVESPRYLIWSGPFIAFVVQNDYYYILLPRLTVNFHLILLGD